MQAWQASEVGMEPGLSTPQSPEADSWELHTNLSPKQGATCHGGCYGPVDQVTPRKATPRQNATQPQRRVE